MESHSLGGYSNRNLLAHSNETLYQRHFYRPKPYLPGASACRVLLPAAAESNNIGDLDIYPVHHRYLLCVYVLGLKIKNKQTQSLF